jgi:RsiW-degrading membrane proteinase PrsW (M82 family)
MKYLGYALLALLPGIFWVYVYLRKDLEKPEPPKLILKIFLYGMAITIPAVAFEFALNFFFPFIESTTLPAILFGSLLIVSPVEESLKYFVVREGIMKNPHFDEPVDGVIYAVVAGLGFATLENILVALSEGGTIILFRFATATLMHALTSGILGYHLGLAMIKPEKKKELVVQGLIVAIILHTLYNVSVSLSSNFVITGILLAVLLTAMYLILAQGIKELKRYPARTKKILQ